MGRVRQPISIDLSTLKGRPRQEVVYTLECAGNHGFPWFTTGIGTARWAGTPLGPLLKKAGVLEQGKEVVFWGSDGGEEEVRQIKMPQNFARSMSLTDAMNPGNLLRYEMNGTALTPPHGFPVRLIAPGWYGIANVKWLKRFEVRETPLMNRFMARNSLDRCRARSANYHISSNRFWRQHPAGTRGPAHRQEAHLLGEQWSGEAAARNQIVAARW